MSRKDYVAIAAILHDIDTEYDDGEEAVVRVIARELADYFKSDNPNFDRDRFYEACGW